MTTQFYMVASALPRMPASFKVEAPPISRIQLEKRLKLLPAENLALAYALEYLLWQSWFMPQKSFSSTKEAYIKLLKTDSPFIHKTVHWFMDLRSLFAALRLRKEKKAPPANPQECWLSHWNHQLIQHWDEPDFGLKGVYPWLSKVASDLEKEDTSAVEEFLLDYIWHYLSIIELRHYFDFEALMIYLLRWNLIHYWSKFNSNLADNFDELVKALIHDDIKGLVL
ncbi:hypothetical protein BN59_03283 [Legionella massiliensis]|uniref:V-type ATP synthase subunit A n=1 Tax=Legionella massiliensis TaxID=1034943 RepID=A0A078L4Y6_9GAMM|nr:DUF2764 family protein [Legionella massiliensis]CDZ78968.1 hypothetical protein BN59_03283 [Legionella massiliensis]CEE14706.1 hypothetical protein BN1094_03283 [Legionella massiliensis]